MRTTLLHLIIICGFLSSNFNALSQTDKKSNSSIKSEMPKFYLELDGIDQYAQSINMTTGLGEATIMGWIKIGSFPNLNSFLFGSNNFHMSLQENGKMLVASANGQDLLCSKQLATDRWYHIAAVYNGTDDSEKLKIYVNGVKESTSNSEMLSQNLLSDASKFTIGKLPEDNSGFFKGGIDEIRVFNTAISQNDLRKMIYQEIENHQLVIQGSVIPKDIEGLQWSSLIACYSLNDFKDTRSRNSKYPFISPSDINSFLKIYHVKTLDIQTAPMPFKSLHSGNLEASLNRNSEVNGSDAFNYEWSIVQISHNVTIASNHTSLGLIIDKNATINVSNNNKLLNNWYLKLDGKIDLKEDAQLVQTSDSDLDIESQGYIERDQQGQSNKYNYNYWSSPVGKINFFSNNTGFTVAEVMRDGTDPENLLPISWTNSLNGEPTTPITLSNYWIYKYQNYSAVNSNWQNVGPSGTLLPGQGFTLKGSDATTSSQNYSFVGKPNNGIIKSPIINANLNLCGNPYPSALDADQFILDNKSVINGTIYFYEQFNYNNTHSLANYQGGYSTRNLVGGVPAVSITGQNTNKTPGRYIPVSQGFLVKGRATGFLEFNNNQRVFVREDNSESQSLFRSSTADAIPNAIYTNDDSPTTENHYENIRLGMDSADNHHRQILLGFMNENATAGIDVGYDAINIDNQPNDISFMVAGNKLLIQGDSFYDTNKSYPLSVKSGVVGIIKIVLDGTENFSESQQILIYDNQTGISTNLRDFAFEVFLEPGTFDNRFSLRFFDTIASKNLNSSTLAIQEFKDDQTIAVSYTNENHKIIISNTTNSTVENVSLYNLPGQNVGKWTVAYLPQSNIQLPAPDLSTGTYIVKVRTTNGEITKKIVIQ